MTNQKNENGFTPLVNELFEKIYQSNFSLREIKIILAVIRYTDGFKRDSAELSLSFLSDAAKIHLRHVQTTVKNLIGKNVLVIVNNSKGKKSREIQFNKNYDSWNLSIDQKGKSSITISENTSIDQKSSTFITGSVITSQTYRKTYIHQINDNDCSFYVPLNQYLSLRSMKQSQYYCVSKPEPVISSIDQKGITQNK